MKLFNSKVVVVLLVAVAGLLLANLVSLWIQNVNTSAQTSSGSFNIVPVATGGFTGAPAPGTLYWGLYVVLDNNNGGARACFIAYDFANDRMKHVCTTTFTSK